MVKVAIIGGSGYTGLELLRLLSRHPEVELTGRYERDERMADLDSVMREIDDARLEEDARQRRVQDRMLEVG